jgi:hypothetical protein
MIANNAYSILNFGAAHPQTIYSHVKIPELLPFPIVIIGAPTTTGAP